MSAPTRYRVTWAYVTCLAPSMGGLVPGRGAAAGMMVGFCRGAILPPDAPAETLERLLGKGAIEPIEETE